jgi:putative peptide zinc metalloprotease protein
MPEGVWATLSARVDPIRQRPRLAPDIETNEFPTTGHVPYTIVCNPRDLVYYRLEAHEAALLPLMDGHHSVNELVVSRLRTSGDLDVDEVSDLVQLLRGGGFLADKYVDSRAALANALESRSAFQRRSQEALRTMTLEWKGAEKFVQWGYRNVLRPAFTAIGAVAAAALALGGFIAFVLVLVNDDLTLTSQSIGVALLLFLVLDVLTVFIHEMGHATYLVHYGRRVKGAGFRIYFGIPSFYIEASDALMLTRRQRILQSFAGPYFQAVAAGAAAVALFLFPSSAIALVLYTFVILNYFILVLNLIPLLELDGYYMLADALRISDLRPRSLAFVRHDLPRKIWHRERFGVGDIGMAAYGILGIAFTVLILLFAADYWPRTIGALVVYLWEGGPIGIFTLVVITLFLGGPVLRAVVQGFRALGREIRSVTTALRFRAQRRWRVEAAELLDAQPAFDDLTIETLSDAAGRVRLLEIGAGAPVVRQGERADAYYVVRRGRLQAVDEHANGAERVLRVLGRGDAFGELAVATGSKRTATVRAVTEAQVFRLDKGSFDRLLADQIHLPDLAPTFQDLLELRTLPPFSGLGTDELEQLRARGSWSRIGPGEAVITEGAAADAFYVVQSGRLEVFEGDHRVRELGAGAHFGEIALLLDSPRTATVRTLTPCRIFRLERSAFDDLVRDSFRGGTLRPAILIDRTWDH